MKLLIDITRTIGCLLLLWVLWFFSFDDFDPNSYEADSAKEVVIIQILPWIYKNTWLKIIISILLILIILGTWMKDKNSDQEVENE